MRADSFSAENVPTRIRFGRTRPDGRRAELIIRRADGSSFSVSQDQMSRILDAAATASTDFEIEGLLVSRTGDASVFAADAGKSEFSLKIN